MSKKYSQKEKQIIVERHTKFAEPPSKTLPTLAFQKVRFIDG